MATEVDRKTLYKQVWETPAVHLGAEYGISGVALRKACLRHGIPVPERGYWAKKKAGYNVKPIPLPPRGPGIAQTIEFGRDRYGWHYPSDEEIVKIPIPPEPSFSEPMEGLQKRVRKMLKGKHAKPTLNKPHRNIARLLDEDRERRLKYETERFPSSWDKPYFDNPLEKSRFRILNGLFLVLESLGIKCTVSGKEGRYICAQVGTTNVYLNLEDEQYLNKEEPLYWRKGENSKSNLVLEISGAKELDEIETSWKGKALESEKTLKEIAFSVIMAGEMFYRNSVFRTHAWKIERKESAIERIEKKKKEVEEKEQERLRQLEEDRVSFLLALSESLMKAEKIRGLVSSLQEKFANGELKLTRKEFEVWSSWALTRADNLDPVISGKVNESISMLEETSSYNPES